jgi:hypothetical protein
LLTLLAVTVFVPTIKAQDDPPKPPELKVLEQLVGTWKDEATFKTAIWTPKERKESTTQQGEWALKGRFLSLRGRNGDGGEDLQLMTFDPDQKAFRRWYFDSEGNATESTGQWDEKTRTLTWTGSLGDGVTAVSVWKFTDKNTLDWTRIAKDDKGKIYVNIEGKSVRQK